MPGQYNVEIIVVDNASTDNTASVVDKFAKDNDALQVRYIHEPRLGKTFALNLGISISGGDILAFVDDDHIVGSGYLEAACQAAEANPSFSLFCGRIIPNWDGNEPVWVHDDKIYPIRPFPIPNFNLGDAETEVRLEQRMFIPGAGNLVVHKSVFDRAGLFSEMLGPKGHNLAGGEDIEFVKRALRMGERLLYVPEILQYHQVERSKLCLSYLLKKAYLRSIASYQFRETGTDGNVPAYLYGQAFERAVKAVFTLDQNARRYYLVRLAAALGEIRGTRRNGAAKDER